MASIYSKSAPRRLAWPRYTVNQPQAGLHGLVEVFASVKQACGAPSKSSPASSRFAWPCRTLRQRQAGLHGPVEHFASVKQACKTRSNTSPASSRLAGPCRSLRQPEAGLHGPVEHFASIKQACGALSNTSPASNGHGFRIPRGDWGGGQLWGREEGLGAGIYLCPRFKPKKKQIYEQFDLPIPESGK